MLPTHWRHVTGMTAYKVRYKNCPFFLTSKNDMVMHFTGYRGDSFFGLEVKKVLIDQVCPSSVPELDIILSCSLRSADAGLLCALLSACFETTVGVVGCAV